MCCSQTLHAASVFSPAATSLQQTDPCTFTLLVCIAHSEPETVERLLRFVRLLRESCLICFVTQIQSAACRSTQGPQAKQRLPRDIGVLHKLLLVHFKHFPVNLCKVLSVNCLSCLKRSPAVVTQVTVIAGQVTQCS